MTTPGGDENGEADDLPSTSVALTQSSTTSDEPPTSVAPSTAWSSPMTSSPRSSESTTPPAPTPTSSTLPASGIQVPAAWSGTAKVTVTVIGECAAATPSVYSGIPADLALDLLQNEASAAETPLPDGADGNDIALTLGVNLNGVPALAVYSSQLSSDGAQVQRFWDLTLLPGTDRTNVTGVLVNDAPDSGSNSVIDAETSLQSCEPADTVTLPRHLAKGATMTGWLSSTAAELTLHAETTDHRRVIEVDIQAQRRS